MSSPAPPHYRAFRLALTVALVAAMAAGLWWSSLWLPAALHLLRIS